MSGMTPLFEAKPRKPKYLIIDFANLVYRTATVKTKTTFSRADGYPTGHLFLFVRSLVAILKKYPGRIPIFAMEGANDFRKKIFPEYKAQREHDTTFDPFPDLIQMLPMLACGIAVNPHWEADDVIASLVMELPTGQDDKHVVLTNDKDMWQLHPRAIIVNGSKGEIVDADVEKAFECPVESIALCKAIFGDVSDNVPRIKNLRWAQVKPYLQKYHTPPVLFEAFEAEVTPAASIQKLLVNREQVEKMFEITRLHQVDFDLTIFPGQIDRLRTFFERYEMNSLLAEVSRLTNPLGE